MFKKWVALGLAAIVLLAATACGEKEDDKAGTVTTTAASTVTTGSAVSGETTATVDTVTTTGTQTTTTQPNEIPSAPKTSLTVLDIAFERLLYSEAGILCGVRDGKWGAINEKGETIIPFEFDALYCPTPNGHVVASKITGRVRKGGKTFVDSEQYLYDAAGTVLYQTEIKEGFFDEQCGHYVTLNGEEMVPCNGNVVLTVSNVRTSTIPATYTITLRKLDGTAICSFDNVIGHTGFSNGAMAISICSSNKEELLTVDTNGTVLTQTSWENIGKAAIVGVWGKGIPDGFFLINNTQTNSACIMSADLKTAYFVNVNEKYPAVCEQYGTLITMLTEDEKYVLVDVSKIDQNNGSNIEQAVVSTKKYDYITLEAFFDNEIQYAYAEKDGKIGLISLTDFSEVWYNDVGHFYGGHTIVQDGNSTYVINEQLEKISNEIGIYDEIYTFGKTVFAMKKDGKFYPILYTP